MNRVLIIGSSGSGKSTFSKQLHEITNIPLIHLDSHRHLPNWIEIKGKEWEEKVISFCEQPSWIMDGNYNGSMNLRFKYADTIFFLHYPRAICLYRGLKRAILSNRVDPISGCKERVKLSFLKWIWTYNDVWAPKIIKKLNDLESKEVLIFNHPRELKLWLLEIEDEKIGED